MKNNFLEIFYLIDSSNIIFYYSSCSLCKQGLTAKLKMARTVPCTHRDKPRYNINYLIMINAFPVSRGFLTKFKFNYINISRIIKITPENIGRIICVLTIRYYH